MPNARAGLASAGLGQELGQEGMPATTAAAAATEGIGRAGETSDVDVDVDVGDKGKRAEEGGGRGMSHVVSCLMRVSCRSVLSFAHGRWEVGA